MICADRRQERSLVSVADSTRRDGEAFLDLVPRIPVQTTVMPYRLLQANRALDDLRRGRFDGAVVIIIDPEACAWSSEF